MRRGSSCLESVSRIPEPVMSRECLFSRLTSEEMSSFSQNPQELLLYTETLLLQTSLAISLLASRSLTPAELTAIWVPNQNQSPRT